MLLVFKHLEKIKLLLFLIKMKIFLCITFTPNNCLVPAKTRARLNIYSSILPGSIFLELNLLCNELRLNSI